MENKIKRSRPKIPETLPKKVANIEEVKGPVLSPWIIKEGHQCYNKLFVILIEAAGGDISPYMKHLRR